MLQNRCYTTYFYRFILLQKIRVTFYSPTLEGLQYSPSKLYFYPYKNHLGATPGEWVGQGVFWGTAKEWSNTPLLARYVLSSAKLNLQLKTLAVSQPLQSRSSQAIEIATKRNAPRIKDAGAKVLKGCRGYAARSCRERGCDPEKFFIQIFRLGLSCFSAFLSMQDNASAYRYNVCRWGKCCHPNMIVPRGLISVAYKVHAAAAKQEPPRIDLLLYFEDMPTDRLLLRDSHTVRGLQIIYLPHTGGSDSCLPPDIWFAYALQNLIPLLTFWA